MQEYTPNSHKYKESQKTASEETKRVEKVVTGNVKVRKKSDIRKAAEGFFNEDFASVRTQALHEVFIPGAKKLLSDVLKSAIDSMFGTSRSRESGSTSKISYRKYSDHYRDDYPRDDYVARTVKSRFDYDDIEFDSRAEAEIVLDRMAETIERFGYVTIADMYDMAGLSHVYTTNRYGWTSVRTGEVVKSHDGYIIKLPKARLLD